MNPTSSSTSTPPAPLGVIIVEDLLILRQDLVAFFRQHPDFLFMGACSTVHDAIELIHTTAPDLLLLDIGLPDGTGFDILEQITEPCKVIFLTAHHEYAIQAFEYGAIHYLLKPFSEKKLREALQRVINAQPPLPEQIAITLQSFRMKKIPNFVALRGHDVVDIVDPETIIYMQAEDNYTIFFLNTNRKLVLAKPLKEYEERFADTFFIRTHQSYLVNHKCIQRYFPIEGKILLSNGTEVLVSDRRKEMVEQYLKNL